MLAIIATNDELMAVPMASEDNSASEPGDAWLTTFDPDSELSVRWMLRSWLIEWFGAVEQQAMRTLFDQEFNPIRIKREGYLLVVAVRQVLRAVEAAQKHANKYRDSDRSKALGAALRKFDSSVPQAVDVRDVLVHFDRYQQGTGKLQDADTKAKRSPQRLNIYCSRTGEEVWLHLMPRLSIELGATLGATAELVEDVVAALD